MLRCLRRLGRLLDPATGLRNEIDLVVVAGYVLVKKDSAGSGMLVGHVGMGQDVNSLILPDHHAHMLICMLRGEQWAKLTDYP